MSVERPHWPAVLRPFVAYRPPPTRQPTRSESPRDVWVEVSRFLDRAAKPYARTGEILLITAQRWSAEGARGKPASLLGEWPSECTPAAFDAAVRLAHERFGKPRFRPNARRLALEGVEFERGWRVPTDRIDEVLEFLDCIQECTGGESAPVRASYSCLFLLRDLETGLVIPNQGTRHYPVISSFHVDLQRRCCANLTLTLPFGEPDAAAANYVVALQEHVPVWLDPRYFDHMVPAPDGSRFRRTRLAPSWIGVTSAGDLRLDVSRSRITPLEVRLPTEAEMAEEDATRDDEPFRKNYVAVATALREHSLATLVIRGASDAEYMAEQAAAWLEMPLHVIRTIRVPKSPTIEDELRTVVSGLDGRRAVLFLEIVPYAKAKTNAALLSQIAGRVLLGVELPPELRLVVSVEAALGEAARATESRYSMALAEGFLTLEQRDFLSRQAERARWRDVVIEVLPIPLGSS